MQMNFDSATVGSRTSALPNVTTLAIDYKAQRRVSSLEWDTVRLKAHREKRRGDTLENIVWTAVGLCAVAALGISFFA